MAATTRLSSIACGILVALLASSALGDEPAPATVKPKPLVTISKETTFITEPLRPDGYPDYGAAMNAKCGRDVTPDNNAAVLLLQAIGPKLLPAEIHNEFFRLLGIVSLPEEGPYFVGLAEFAKRWVDVHPELKKVTWPGVPLPADDESAIAALALLRKNGFALTAQQEQSFLQQDTSFVDLLGDQLDKAMQAPWSASEYPLLAKWLAENEEPLGLAVAASERPRYFWPLLTRQNDALLLTALLPELMDLRELCKSLAARAMLQVKQGKFDQACKDMLACHRWARLVSQRLTLIDSLIGYALESLACTTEQALANSGALTTAQLGTLQARLAGLPPLPAIADTIDQGERLFGLDVITSMARSGSRAITPQPEQTATAWTPYVGAISSLLLDVTFDWDEVLRRINAGYDRLVTCSKIPAMSQRNRALAAYEAELRALDGKWTAMGSLKLLIGGRSARGQRMAEILTLQLFPSVSMVVTAQDRVLAARQVTQLSLALDAYRTEHGVYPGTLAELVPADIKEVPKDPFSERDLIYKSQQGGGYLLYSVGPNGQDDGGRNKDTDPDSEFDDILVRAQAPPK